MLFFKDEIKVSALRKKNIVGIACCIMGLLLLIVFYSYKIGEQLADRIADDIIKPVSQLAEESPEAIMNDLQLISKAIKEYKEAEMKSPSTLLDLTPKFLPELPKSMAQYSYTLVNGGEYILVEPRYQKPEENKKWKFRVPQIRKEMGANLSSRSPFVP